MHIQAVNAAYGNAYGPQKPGHKTVPAPKESKTEKVQISDISSELQTVKSVIENVEEVRLEVVKEIKARIKSNDYPLENNLNETVKALIKNRILNPM